MILIIEIDLSILFCSWQHAQPTGENTFDSLYVLMAACNVKQWYSPDKKLIRDQNCRMKNQK